MYTATRAKIIRRIEYDDYALLLVKPDQKIGEAVEPSVLLFHDSVQALFEDLYAMGFRSSNEPKEDNQHLAAVSRHLNHVANILDMVLPLALSDEVRPNLPRFDVPPAPPELIRRPRRATLPGRSVTAIDDVLTPESSPGMVVGVDPSAPANIR